MFNYSMIFLYGESTEGMFEGLFDFSIISDEFVYKVDFPYTFLDGLVYFGGVEESQVEIHL